MSTYRSRQMPPPDMSETKRLVYERPQRAQAKPLLPGWVLEGLLYLLWAVIVGLGLLCAYALAQILITGD